MVGLLLFKLITAILLVVGMVFGQDTAREISSEGDLDRVLQENKYVLVKFYQPECQFSERMRPHFEQAAAELGEMDVEGGLALVKVDCSILEQVRKRFGVAAYPTLKWFFDGVHSDYDGGQKAHHMTKWIKARLNPPYVFVEDADGLSDLTNSNELVVVGFFQDLTSDNALTFKMIAQSSRDKRIKFAITNKRDMKSSLRVLKSEGVSIFCSFDEEEGDRPVACPLGFDFRNSVLKCIELNSLPLLIVHSKESENKLLAQFGSKPFKVCFLFLAKEFTDEERNKIKGIAKAHMNDFRFMIVKPGNDLPRQFFNVESRELPTYRLFVRGEDGKVEKFSPEEGTITEGFVSLEPFLRQAQQGASIQPVARRSEKVDEDDLKGDVWILRGSNHDDVVYDENINVMVMYRTEACNRCSKYQADFETFSDLVQLAVFDGEKNECPPELQITNFPTFIMFPKGGKERKFVMFTDLLNLDNLKRFIEQEKR